MELKNDTCDFLGNSGQPSVFLTKDGKVILDPRQEAMPAAYYRRSEKWLYVDKEFRSRVRELLKAEMAKDGKWTFLIRDEEQEADEKNDEEVIIPYYDPVTGPQVGDTVVYPDRRCINVTYIYECYKLEGGTEWIKREPLTIGRCLNERTGGCFEEWHIVGQATLYSDDACTTVARVADLYGWECLEL